MSECRTRGDPVANDVASSCSTMRIPWSVNLALCILCLCLINTTEAKRFRDASGPSYGSSYESHHHEPDDPDEDPSKTTTVMFFSLTFLIVVTVAFETLKATRL